MRASRLFLLAGLATLVVVAPSAQADITNVSGNNLTFGDTQVGSTTGTQTVTITNNGGTDVVLDGSGVTPTGNTGSFNLSGDTCANATLTASGGTSCKVDVQFAPAVAGNLSVNLSVSDGSNSQQVATASGTGLGTPTDGVTPPSWDFGSSGASKQFTLTNSGTGDLTVSSVSVTGTDFSLQGENCSGTVPASSSCTFTV
jgi:trimeric autotransporter adhesin